MTDRDALVDVSSQVASWLAGGTLLAAAGLHVGWAYGSAFPFKNRDVMSRNVVGLPEKEFPGKGMALLVAGACAAGAASTLSRWRFGSRATGVVMLWRGVAGLTMIDVFPAGPDPAFARMNRYAYSPASLGVGLLAWRAPRRRRREPGEQAGGG